MTDSDLRRISL